MAATSAHGQPIFTTAPPSLQRLQPMTSQPSQPSQPQTPSDLYGVQQLRRSLPPQASTETRAPPRQIPLGPAPTTAEAPAAAPQVPVAQAPVAPAPVAQAPMAQAPVAQAPVAQAPSTAQTAPVAPAPGMAPVAIPASPQMAAPKPFTPTAQPRQPITSHIGSLKENGVVLRHLSNNVQGFRLTGEIGSSEWPLYMTESQIQRGLKFQIGFLSAVSVMPEASYLTLMINDQTVGRTNITGSRGVRTAVFDIPDGLMKAGFNSIRIMAEQRHRVDCSLQATYELWTQIDPTQTGLVLSGSGAVTNIAELAALPVDEQGAMPIRAVIPGKTSVAGIDRVIRATQMLALYGRFQQTVVDVGPLADGIHGINLAIGTIAEIGSLLGPMNVGQVLGPRVVIVPASGGKRTTVVFTGRTDEDVNAALRQFAISSELKGTPQGIRAAQAFPGYRLFGGERVKLRDLGVISQEFSGRLFRVGFNVVLPPDFYSADYAKVILDLAGGYAPGLRAGAQVVVSVNTRTAVSLSLPKSSGDVFQRNPIPIPLGTLRPGLNRIEIEAQLAVPSDTACDPLAAITGQKRFLLLDSTEIELPKIARIGRMPDLAVTATGAFPYAAAEKRPVLYVPAPSKEAIGAAATIATRLATSAGKPIDFELTLSAPTAEQGPALIVAPALSVQGDTFKSVGLQQQAILDNWNEAVNAEAAPLSDQLTRTEAMARHRLVLQRNFPAACHMPTPQGGYRTAEASAKFTTDRFAVGAIGEADKGLYDEWDSNIRNQGGIIGRAVNTYNRVVDWGSSLFSDTRGWIGDHFEVRIQRPVLTRQASLVMAQDLTGSTPDGVRTLVTAPNAAMLAQSVACLIDPRVWQQISGRVSVLNAAEGAMVDIPVENARLVATQPMSIDNMRLIAAGWLSLNRNIYVLLAFILALVLACATHWFLKGVGRST
ncbi:MULTISPECIES: cellulose biosynthesis cyclic di-GMP-binding regulatory protein BcsB [unclassified Beijerinckia]|uniref:cellulose biosynthesis cyclic di-GMP-binding regulatory protein BcsB n=1 Tax=unclassified Beijerinckia TaxID=2638183 RepID=UPI00147EB03B|nr:MULTISPECIES: cellulose biosynthesis cyclic di-GMP-binding regulatory protein BcsB [unclassified Beijerinckia]